MSSSDEKFLTMNYVTLLILYGLFRGLFFVYRRSRMTNSKTELWRLRSGHGGCTPDSEVVCQKLSVTSQAMDLSEMAVARSSFHQLAYLCIYTPFHVSCSSCLSRNQMGSLPMCGEIDRQLPSLLG